MKANELGTSLSVDWNLYSILGMPIYTKISKVNLSAFVYRLFHEHFSSIVGADDSDDCGEILMKQSVNKCK